MRIGWRVVRWFGLALCMGSAAAACGGSGDDDVSSTDKHTADAGSEHPRACNGSAALCALRYDQVTYAATHDAFSYAAGGPATYQVPNQDRPIAEQLAYSIRALGIRPCPYFGSDPAEQGRVYVTHNSQLKGALGTEPLADVLGEVRTFLKANPNEVLTLLAESSVKPSALADTFRDAGLMPYVYTHDRAKGWPTLGKMIERGTRLVVFNDSQDADRPAWQHFMWDFIVDTDYNITNAEQFSCTFYRGTSKNDLYFINEFVYRDLGGGVLVPDKANAAQANDEQFVFARSISCWRETGRIPNFVYVDWFGQGNVRGAVHCLNALPRDVPPANASCDDADSGTP